ncbi:hypothetical protein JW916_02345 [Candidatus Sumerlaeota bacterium]|nr:hypothetical protein [Candidatus Sumerlaeota bacterium]
MTEKRNKAVYAALLCLWVLICAWQGGEHRRVKKYAREGLTSRARDISNSLGVVIRSQGRFGMIRYSRLQAALDELVKSQELLAVVLLNSEGEVVASACNPPGVAVEELAKQPNRWSRDFAVFANLVDLGANAQDGVTSRPATIILPPEEAGGRGADDSTTSPALRAFPPPPPPPDEEHARPPEPPRYRSSRRGGSGGEGGETSPSLSLPDGDRDRDRDRDGRRRPRWLGRPPWMSEERYNDLLQERGLHGFILQMSTASYRAETARDLRLRLALIAVAFAALFAIAVGWNNVRRSSELQIRLLRASEMNRHLKEMNVAAAGLAHETRNPLNIVRGLAQMIAQNPTESEEVRERSRHITDEVDRVTVRLNEFINYSKPPVPRPAPTRLRAVATDVERALDSDIAEKAVRFAVAGPDLAVVADESLLRQVLFNLLINAVQAVSPGGRIEIRFETPARGEAAIEVVDDGPGVAHDQERDIFQPYFTTREGGTGLGLAVVRQIVLAHQWDVEYIRGESGLTRFRVSGIKIA